MSNLSYLNSSLKSSQAAVKRYRQNVKKYPGYQIWITLLELEIKHLEDLKKRRQQERNRLNELRKV